MDDILSFFISVNKISLLAFLGVLGFLVYEISLLRKEQLKKQKPNIPQFNTAAVVDTKTLQQQAATLVAPKKVVAVKRTKSPPIVIFLLILSIIVFSGISAYLMFMNREKKKTDAGVPKIIVNEVQSPGLKVFDQNWSEVTDTQTADVLNRGGRVYVGIQTIDDADIDRARIKVNKKDWNVTDITERFKSEKKMYYIDYEVASGTAQLRIDAQLHSAADGWLGD